VGLLGSLKRLSYPVSLAEKCPLPKFVPSCSVRLFSLQTTTTSTPTTPAFADIQDKLPSDADHKELIPQKAPGTTIPESFAIVHVAGHQYKVTKGDTVLLDKLPVAVGDNIFLSKVLMIGTKDFTAIGTPMLKQAAVSATVQEQTQTGKVIVFKKSVERTMRGQKGTDIKSLW